MSVLLVTGASSDVGAALIQRVAGNYDTIAAHYGRSRDRIEQLQNEFGNKIIPLQADFTDEASTASLAETILGRCLAPAHWVHLPSNAESAMNQRFSKTTWAAFERELSISLRSAVILYQAFLPSMSKMRHGRIIFMLSFHVEKHPPVKFASAYTTVKYALLGLTRTLSAEYSDKGVTVNAVSPSMIDTKFLDGVPKLIVQKNAEASPIGRNLNVGDVVPTFEFLLSDGAGCVTGQNIEVSAGN